MQNHPKRVGKEGFIPGIAKQGYSFKRKLFFRKSVEKLWELLVDVQQKKNYCGVNPEIHLFPGDLFCEIMGSTQGTPQMLGLTVVAVLLLYCLSFLFHPFCACQGLCQESPTAARGGDFQCLPAEPGSKPSQWSFVFPAHFLLQQQHPSTAGVYFAMQTDEFLSLFANLWLSAGRACTWWPSFWQTPGCGHTSFGVTSHPPRALCFSLVLNHSSSLPSVAAGALQESAVPTGWIFQSASLGLVGSPREWILWCPAGAEAPAETVTGFFYPNASFRSCNLKPVVSSSPIVNFLTNFGWVWLHKQINCFEGSLFLCILFQTSCAGAAGRGTGNFSGSWWRTKPRSGLSVSDTMSQWEGGHFSEQWTPESYPKLHKDNEGEKRWFEEAFLRFPTVVWLSSVLPSWERAKVKSTS